MIVYGVVRAETEKVIEFFHDRESAEGMINKVREDEPELATSLRVEAVRIGDNSLN